MYSYTICEVISALLDNKMLTSRTMKFFISDYFYEIVIWIPLVVKFCHSKIFIWFAWICLKFTMPHLSKLTHYIPLVLLYMKILVQLSNKIALWIKVLYCFRDYFWWILFLTIYCKSNIDFHSAYSNINFGKEIWLIIANINVENI